MHDDQSELQVKAQIYSTSKNSFNNESESHHVIKPREPDGIDVTGRSLTVNVNAKVLTLSLKLGGGVNK